MLDHIILGQIPGDSPALISDIPDTLNRQQFLELIIWLVKFRFFESQTINICENSSPQKFDSGDDSPFKLMSPIKMSPMRKTLRINIVDSEIKEQKFDKL